MEFTLESGTHLLARTPSVLSKLLVDLPEVWTMASNDENQWSPYQVVGHMTYLESSDWMDRAHVIVESDPDRDPPHFRPIDREAGFSVFEGWSLGNLVQHFAELRSANLTQLSALVGDDDLQRVGRHPDFGDVTLRQLLATWIAHDLNHLGQIVKSMAKLYGDAVGPWRAYLPIIDAE